LHVDGLRTHVFKGLVKCERITDHDLAWFIIKYNSKENIIKLLHGKNAIQKNKTFE